MILKIVGAFLLLLLFGTHSLSLAFSNIFQSPKNSNPISQNLTIEFPRDHGSHESSTIEWWYVTANLKDAKGNSFGIQWTLFRSSVDDFYNSRLNQSEEEILSWDDNQIWMAHAAVTSKNSHYFSEKLARGGSGQAGVKGEDFSAWIDDWVFFGNKNWNKLKVQAKGKNFEYSLNLKTDGPIILNGNNGYSVKTHEGHSSAYYSLPFLKVDGKIIMDDATFLVKGVAWIDREWSSAMLGPNQDGWDWFSLHLDNGDKLMLFRVRDKEAEDFFSGTLVTANKKILNLDNTKIKMKPLTYQARKATNERPGSNVPTSWRLKIKSQNIDVITKAINSHSYIDGLVPYWEGPITISGSHSGVGYLEMTGY